MRLRPRGPSLPWPGVAGAGTLLKAAEPLLALAPRLRTHVQPRDVDHLYARVKGEIERFTQNAASARLPSEEVSVGRYALCALLDDVVLNTPWGPRSRWPAQRLVGRVPSGCRCRPRLLSRARAGGARARAAPRPARADVRLPRDGLRGGLSGQSAGGPHPATDQGGSVPPARSLPQPGRPLALAELAGSGRRAGPRAAQRAGLDRRGRRPGAARDPLCRVQLSPVRLWRRRGLTTCPRPRRSAWPGSACAPPPALPPPPAPRVVLATQSLEGFLAAEQREGLVEVFDRGRDIVVLLRGEGLFDSGSAEVRSELPAGTIARIGQALEDRAGTIRVVGHSDNVPIRTARFPSNWELSQARATSVARALAREMSDPRGFASTASRTRSRSSRTPRPKASAAIAGSRSSCHAERDLNERTDAPYPRHPDLALVRDPARRAGARHCWSGSPAPGSASASRPGIRSRARSRAS